MYNRCFTKEDIERVFKIECFQKPEDVFLGTHYALTFMFKDPYGVEKEISEDSLIERWEEDYNVEKRRRINEYIRTFIVWGATGTGKTELCRWLELTIPRETGYEKRRFSKRSLAMAGILGIALELSEGKVDLRQQLEAKDIESVAVFILRQATEQGRIRGMEGIFRNEDSEIMLKDIIKHNIKDRIARVDGKEDVSGIESVPFFIRNADLLVLQFDESVFDLERANDIIFKGLVPLIVGIEDIKQLIFDYIREKNIENVVPVLIFDDVTQIGGGLVDEFISVMTDISADEGYMCDFVIGTTTDFYLRKFKDKLTSTAQARLHEMKLSPEERGELEHAGWLVGNKGKSHYLDFVKKYLQFSRGCVDCSDRPCENTIFQEDGVSYYPFTKTFLINLYRRLQYEKKEITPRNIIKFLKNTLKHFAETGKCLSKIIDDLFETDSIFFFVDLNRSERNEMAEFLRTLWWYGQSENDEIKIDQKTLTTLGEWKYLPEIIKSRFKEENGQKLINLHVSSIERVSSFITDVKPVAPDDTRRQTSILKWCKGDKRTEIPINIIADGFDHVFKTISAALPGSNSFYNLNNPRSSRMGGSVEYVSRVAKKRSPVWIGDLRDDQHLVFALSQYFEPNYRQLKDKFPMVFLDEEDFFWLYKIGSKKVEPKERQKYLQNFLRKRYGDVLSAANHLRIITKVDLDEALNVGWECWILSFYIVCNALLRSNTIAGFPSNIEDLIARIKNDDENGDMNTGSWPANMDVTISMLSKYYPVIRDIFFSTYSLRGESILDLPLLKNSMHIINENGGFFDILKEANDPEKNYVMKSNKYLGKSTKELKEIIDMGKNAVVSVLEGIKGFEKDKITSELTLIKEKVKEIGELTEIRNKLEQLCKKLKQSTEYIQEYREIQALNRKYPASDLTPPMKMIERIDQIVKDVDAVEDPIEKVQVMRSVNLMKEDPLLQYIQYLEAYVNTIDRKLQGQRELDFARIKMQYKKFLDLEKKVEGALYGYFGSKD